MRQSLVGPLSSRSTSKASSDPGKQLASKGGTYVGRSYASSGPSANSGNVANLIGVYNSPSPSNTSFRKSSTVTKPDEIPSPLETVHKPKPPQTPPPIHRNPSSDSTPIKSNDSTPIKSNLSDRPPIPKLPIPKVPSKSNTDTASKPSLNIPSNPEKIKRISVNIENRIAQLMDHQDSTCFDQPCANIIVRPSNESPRNYPQRTPPPVPKKPLPQVPKTVESNPTICNSTATFCGKK
jgi:hypothetical protein